ncbi:cobalt transporter CbiM [Desulfitobacterium sp.]|uniref:cobalt transporter CbiM n=1 Tax=Desulfitobacterium sp. TaxID=49981 RepID=UPI0039C8819B
MHIPDGYLSPQTDAVLGIASAIAAAGAAYQTAHTVKAKYVPLLSIGAAFSFTIMMFNIPIPDGTTAHAVGGTLLSILLGPWAAMVGVSIALTLQALFFGDGGILALGANIFNMAVVLPFVSYGVYRLIAGRSNVQSKRQWIAAAIAGYIGLNVAALCTGIEFGLQPLLFHTPDGIPLYSPYGLYIAVPAMLFSHLTIAGPIEGLITALVVIYLQRTNPAMLQLRQTSDQPTKTFRYGKFVLGIVILAVLSPLGLLASGTAWGEWGQEELHAQLGFLPSGFQKFGDVWKHSLLPDYGRAGFDQSFWQQALVYLVSAFVGLLVIGLIAFIIQRHVRKSE